MMSDHRELGQKLDLFMFSPLSPGCPIWLPKGMQVYNKLLNRIRQLNEVNNYLEVRTPIIWKPELYKLSGHLEHYASNMFFVGSSNKDNIYLSIEGEACIKPMNCPGHMEIFKSQQWSYKDLPIGFAEYSPLHRNEVSGAIGGLTRCRCFCQDDAHVFCSPETLQSEIKKIILMIHEVYNSWFNMEYRAVLSTRPEKFMGSIETWQNAEKALFDVLEESLKGESVEISPGDGAFYGPKIDFIVKDSLGREWQTATIQLDFQLPEKFNLEYTNKNNITQRPIVIHRAIFGSFERFIAILLESLDGKLPFWLSPISVSILPISDKTLDYAQELHDKLKNIGVRSEINENGTLSQKIVIGHEKKIPCLVILGEKEKSNRTITMKMNEKQETISLEVFISKIMELN